MTSPEAIFPQPTHREESVTGITSKCYQLIETSLSHVILSLRQMFGLCVFKKGMFSFIVVFRSQDAPIDQPAITIGRISVICDWLGVKMTNDCWRQYLNHKHELPVWYQLISWSDDWLVGPAMSAPADTSSHDHDCGRVRSIPPSKGQSWFLFWRLQSL